MREANLVVDEADHLAREAHPQEVPAVDPSFGQSTRCRHGYRWKDILSLLS